VADCTHAATKTYKCSVCGDTYTDEEGSANGHNIAGVTPTETLKEGSTCEYIQYYECTECGENVEGDHVFHHNYVARVTKDATCSAVGEKTLTCSACSDSKTEEIAKTPAGHKWVEGTVNDNKREDSCEYCSEKKTVTVYTGNTTGETSAENLKDTEIQLENANISLDSGVIDTIGNKNVTLSADTLSDTDKATVGLTPEELLQVGDSPIYNFTINDGTDNISDFGKDNFVTITLPYIPAEGEDVDSIAIWFIGKNGELESIKATYNNKTVTFKTNHFSYYTVTRLTPAERCKVYGHSYTTTTVAGTCTTDGYELKICVRCHETTKTITSTAPGHEYEKKVTEATCTVNGKTVYECKNCDHHYTVRIIATGHKWVEEENVPATCAAAGYIKYGCEKCDGEYTTPFAQLKHKLTATVVAPTCEDNGYTEHACDNCDYSYTDTVVAPIGHDYEIAWSWSSDFATATLTFTCEHDATHTFTETATVEKTETAATCTVKAKTTYSALAVVNGESYRDTKVVEGSTIDHKYGTAYKSDANKHWHECEMCGGKDEAVAHTYDAGTVTKEATCSANGTKLLKCVCGYEKTETIPATGEHTYENGKCKDCGKEEANCDHKTLVDRVVDLADYGFCGGTLKFKSCECGEVMTFDGDIEVFCDIETTYEEETEEAGIYTAHLKGECAICGLKAEQTHIEKEEGCLETYTVIFSIFDKEGKPIMNKATYEQSEVDHSEKRVELDLAAHTTCGSKLIVLQCAECEEIIDIIGLNGCQAKFERTTATDDKGFVHTYYTDTCETCGLVFTREVWTEKASPCEYTNYTKATLVKGTEVLYEAQTSDHYTNHYTERTAELIGETCEDGILVHYNCRNCDYGYSYMSKGHYTSYETIELEGEGACGGYLYVYRCDTCDTITGISSFESGCKIEPEESVVVGADGTEHAVKVSTCERCGLYYSTERWEEKKSECVYVYHSKVVFKIGDKVILEKEDAEEEEEHDIEREYTLKGETCEDGYVVTEKCKVCGYTDEWNGSGHRTDYTRINLKDKGACGGELTMNQCSLCDAITYNYSYLNCPDFYSTTAKTGTDSEGNTYTERDFTCQRCNLHYYEKSTMIEGENCKYTIDGVLTVKIGDEIIIDAPKKSTTTNHQYEEVVDIIGGNCDYGVFRTEYCTKCGYSYTHEDNGHESRFGHYESAKDLGLCGGEITVETCRDCETVVYLYDNLYCKLRDEGTDENGYDVFVCEECGATVKRGYFESEKDVECNVTTEYRLIIIVNGETVFDKGYVDIHTDHDYEYTFKLQGSTCDDGVQVNATCKDCGATTNYYTGGHSTFDTEIDLSEYGVCGNAVAYISECPCGERKEIRVEFDGCEIEENYEYAEGADGKDGTEKITRSCKKCGLVFVEERYGEIEGCTYTSYTKYNLTVGTNEIFKDVVSENYHDERHDFAVEFELFGESCEDGYIVTHKCKNCDYSYDDTLYHHNSYLMYEVNLEEKACGGYFEYYSCACGQESWANTNVHCFFENGEGSEYTDDDGVKHNVFTDKCSYCGLVRVRDQYEVKNGCKYIVYTKLTLTSGENEVLVDGYAYRDYTRTEHNYEETYEFKGETCKDGVTVTFTCKDCGDSHSSEYTWCSTRLKENIDLSELGGCGGNIEIYECPCGAEKNVYFNYECKTEHNRVSNDEGGYTETNTCPTCGLVVEKVVTPTVREGCYDISYVTYNVTVGDKVALEDYTDVYSKYARHENEQEFTFEGETCEDGVNVTLTCKVCGEKTYEYFSYHSERIRTEIDLTAEGACEGTKIVQSECPCGYSKSSYFEYGCKTRQQYSSGEDENGIYHDYYTYTCKTCGLVAVKDLYELEEGCNVTSYILYDVAIGDKVVVDGLLTVNDRYESHEYLYTFTLNGETCEDGLTALGTCADCGKTVEEYTSWHSTYLVEIVDLADKGACDGAVRVYKCACGERSNVDVSMPKCDLVYEETYVYNDEYDIGYYNSTETCRTCGLCYTRERSLEKIDCTVYVYETGTITIGDELVYGLEKRVVNEYERHNEEVTYKFEGETCEDGLYVYTTCLDCGMQKEDYRTYHEAELKERYDLTEHGVCDGYIEIYECPCGVESYDSRYFCSDKYTSDSYTEDGIEYTVTAETCSKCGFRYQETSHSVRDAETCTIAHHRDVVLSIGEKAIGTYAIDRITYDEHDYKVETVLDEGATTCNEGYTAYYTCVDCGYSYNNHYTWHSNYELQKIDLAELGATCGGYAIEYGCPCGYQHSVEIYEESDCEFDSKWFTTEVEGSISGGSGYDYVCAVTDPACGFTIRRLNYTVQREGTCFTDYHTVWYFGYNAETGEYEKEISYVSKNPGVKHTYENTDVDTTEDGLTVKGTVSTCSVCGTCSSNLNYYNAEGLQVKHVYEFTNKIEDGDNKYRLEIDEYTVYVNTDGKNSTYCSREYYETINSKDTTSWSEYLYDRNFNYVAPFGSNGQEYTETYKSSSAKSDRVRKYAYTMYKGHQYYIYEYSQEEIGTENEYWYRYDYTYNFSDGCLRTELFTNSEGTIKSTTDSCHRTSSYYVEKPTCTQDGIRAYKCSVCEMTNIDPWTASPNGHYWAFNGEEYYCTTCGIKNANGANGDVIMEDLTAKYGNETAFVVGYWNVEGVEYTYYVSLIPIAEGAEEVILEGIVAEELTKVRALSISKSDIAKAISALGLKAEDYQIKFSFVPYGGDEVHDYGVIFDGGVTADDVTEDDTTEEETGKDVNGDGVIDEKDETTSDEIIDVPVVDENGKDVNGDGVIDEKDETTSDEIIDLPVVDENGKDVNGDGVIDEKDETTSDEIVDLPVVDENGKDVNGDGVIDEKDETISDEIIDFPVVDENGKDVNGDGVIDEKDETTSDEIVDVPVVDENGKVESDGTAADGTVIFKPTTDGTTADETVTFVPTTDGAVTYEPTTDGKYSFTTLA